jgi:hypothetical protein
MESRSLTETKNSNWPQWLFWPVLLVCLLPTIFFMCQDTYRSGDEIITYGMANEPEQGWMFSKGRIRAYLDTEIFGDGVGAVPGNLAEAAADVLKNRKQAAFFQMERPSETGSYTGEQMQDYLAITEGESFRLGDIYLNGMGDDANSFLYYLLLHLVSSIAPVISAGKWSGFILNMICLVASLFLLDGIAAFFVEKRGTRWLILFLYACSSAAVGVYTNIRPYALTVVTQEALLLLHLKMLYKLDRNGVSDAKRYIRWLVPVYVLGYISQYTTGIWAVCLALYTIIRAKGHKEDLPTGKSLKHLKVPNPRSGCDKEFEEFPKTGAGSPEQSSGAEKELIRSYLITGILAVILGILVDPMSVLGLLSKLKGTQGSGLAELFGGMLKAGVEGVFGTALWLLPAAALGGIALYRYHSSESRPQIRQMLYFLGLVVFYTLLSTFLMKGHKINIILPYFFILLGMLIAYAAGEPKRWKRILLAVCFLLWAGGMFAGLSQKKKEERKDYLLLEEQLAQFDTDRIVFLRDHGAGYDKIPLLGQYEQIFLWTADEGWESYAAEASQALGDDGLLLLDGDPEALWQEAEAAGVAEGKTAEEILKNEQYMLLHIH